MATEATGQTIFTIQSVSVSIPLLINVDRGIYLSPFNFRGDAHTSHSMELVVLDCSGVLKSPQVEVPPASHYSIPLLETSPWSNDLYPKPLIMRSALFSEGYSPPTRRACNLLKLGDFSL